MYMMRFQAFDKARRAHFESVFFIQNLLTCLHRSSCVLHAKLPHFVTTHHIEMALIGQNSRMALTTRHFGDHNVETARLWYLNELRAF